MMLTGFDVDCIFVGCNMRSGFEGDTREGIVGGRE